MFAYVLILFLLLPLTFLLSTLESLFSPDELSEMGIWLENTTALEPG
jgi:hypothetical protein